MANELQLKELEPRTILYYARDLGTVNDGTLAQAWQVVQELFPDKTVMDLTYEYWLGQHDRPVMATLTPYDVEAPVASRQVATQVVRGELPKIARKIKLGERENLLLLRLLENAALPAEVRQYVQKIYDDVTAMRDAVLARITKLCLDAISTIGPISINEGGVVMQVDFRIPAQHTEVLATPWTDPGSNPYDDIRRWIQTIEDSQGFTPRRALTTTPVVRALLAHDKIRELVLGRNFAGQVQRVPTIQEFNEWAEARGFPVIAALDSRVYVEDAAGNRQMIRLFPEDRFVLLPDGPLGQLLFGTTAEAIGMVQRGIISSEEAPGIWAGIFHENDPPAQWTKAAAIAFPTFPGAEKIFVASVL